MQNTFVWDIIASFTASERREAGLFLASPFFNHREDVRQLYGLLAEATKSGRDAPRREFVFGEIFLENTGGRSVKNEEEFDDQQLRLTASYLLRLLEQYLEWKEFQGAPLARPHLLLAAYRKRQLSRHFQKTLNRAQGQLDRQPLRHPEFFLEKYAVEQQDYLQRSGSDRTQALNLQAVDDQLTAALLGMKLRQACLMRSHEAVFNTRYEVALLDEILVLAQQEPHTSNPAVALYFHCYRALFLEENESNFLAFKQLLLDSVALFPRVEMRDLYLLAINFCIKKVNENARTYYRESLDLYRSGLETTLLLDDGRLSRFTYNNILGIALRMPEEWSWAGRFLNDFRPHLDPAHREATFGLNMARLEFTRKNYNEALGHLQLADYRDLINNLVAKTLQLKIYFETQQFELLESHLRTMRMYIRRNKKLGYHRENWSNIVRYTRKLMELNPFDEQARQLLRSEIENEEILTEKEWLLGQLAG